MELTLSWQEVRNTQFKCGKMEIGILMITESDYGEYNEVIDEIERKCLLILRLEGVFV